MIFVVFFLLNPKTFGFNFSSLLAGGVWRRFSWRLPVCPAVLPGLQPSGPEAAGRRRDVLPQPLLRQPVPTRHQREPVSGRTAPDGLLETSTGRCQWGATPSASGPVWSQRPALPKDTGERRPPPPPPPSSSSSLHRCVCRIQTLSWLSLLLS